MKFRRIITAAGIVACAIGGILLAGLLFSLLNASGFWMLPGFGLLGIIVFWQSFPWFPLIVIIALTFTLSFLLHQCSVCRRHSLFSLSLVLLVLTLLTGFLLSLLPVFSHLQPPPPPKDDHLRESFLRGYGAWRFHNVFRGTLTGAEGSYALHSAQNRLVPLELSAGIRLPLEPQIGSGDTVLIIGEPHNGAIRAFGIRKL